MVASGRASVFIQGAKAGKAIKVLQQLQAIVKSDFSNIIDVVTLKMQAWDHAVGIICVHEAGGKVHYPTSFLFLCVLVYPIGLNS